MIQRSKLDKFNSNALIHPPQNKIEVQGILLKIKVSLNSWMKVVH